MAGDEQEKRGRPSQQQAMARGRPRPAGFGDEMWPSPRAVSARAPPRPQGPAASPGEVPCSELDQTSNKGISFSESVNLTRSCLLPKGPWRGGGKGLSISPQRLHPGLRIAGEITIDHDFHPQPLICLPKPLLQRKGLKTC